MQGGTQLKRVIFLALIHFLLLTSHFSLSYGAILLDRIIAVVNEDVITWSELRRSLEQEEKELIEGLAVKDREEALRGLEKTFLNSMIDIKLQLQEARRKGLDVKDAEVEGAISDIKKKYSLKDEEFVASLNAEGFTLEEYKRRLMEQILLSKVINYEVRSNVFVTDKEIEDFYNANKEKYAQGESVRIRQIFFNAPRDKREEPQLEAKAQEIIKRLKAGQDFAKLAEEYSEDASRRFGGDLGYISRGTVLKEIEDMAFSLKEGEISKLFWSSLGLHIIKVEHKLDLTSPEKAKEEIKRILIERAFRLKYEEWIKDLRSKAYIEIKL